MFSSQLEATLEEKSTLPQFRIGQVVKHKRYGYRGVIVHRDLCCLADDSWYFSNATQPDRDQPWYQILVDESVCTTYAAEENLLPDNDPTPVRHPLVTKYFRGRRKGLYLRNNKPWQG